MGRQRRTISSHMGHSTAETITVRGRDLPNDLLGRINFGDMAFLEVMGRVPDEAESVIINAVLVTLVEHGMTPSAIAARLTYLGAPEAIQAAVAGGMLGVGSVFVGTTEGAAAMLHDAVDEDTGSADVPRLAADIVAAARDEGRHIPGIGHPVHTPVDPRVPRLFEIAAEHGRRGIYVALMEEIARAASDASGRVLPVNATGAIGALLCEIGFDIRVARGLGAMARSVGLVGHIAEEMDDPMATEIWYRIEDEVGEGAASGGRT